MSEKSMPPWDDELSALLNAERDIPKAPPGLKEQVASRLELTAQALNFGSSVESPGVPGESGGWETWLSRAWVKGALTTALVFPVGVWVGKSMNERPMEPAVPAAVAPLEVVVPPSEPTPMAAPEPTEVPAPAPSSDRVKPNKPRSTDASLADERALLEMARTALLSGRYGEASEALRQHEVRFSKGRMREERESLHVQLLLLSGDTEQARKALEAFSKEFPKSMFLPTLREAMP